MDEMLLAVHIYHSVKVIHGVETPVFQIHPGVTLDFAVLEISSHFTSPLAMPLRALCFAMSIIRLKWILHIGKIA